MEQPETTEDVQIGGPLGLASNEVFGPADAYGPHEVSDIDCAFPARAMELMPEYSQIPPEFKRADNSWAKWQAQWFYSGLQKMPTPRPGVDLRKAMRHLQVIQGSFEPKHAHKAAAVAFLASRWLERAP